MTPPPGSSASPGGGQAQVFLDVDPGIQPLPASPRRDDPFHILVLGDFGGEGGSGAGPAEPVPVDRDDLDQALARFAPRLTLPGGEEGVPTSLTFQALEDFHPDRILTKADSLQPLVRWRKELRDPAGARRVVEEARSLERGGGPAAPTAESLLGGSLLDRIVGAQDEVHAAGAEGGRSRSDPGDLAAFLRAVVAPHLVPDRDPDQLQLLADVEAALTAQLRRILHQPRFQALESLWRGVDFLTRQLETGPHLKIHLLRATGADLTWDTNGPDGQGAPEGDQRVEASALFRRLMDHGPPAEGERWGLVVADFPGAPDALELSRRLGALGRSMGAAVVSTGDPELLGLPTLLDGELPEAYPVVPGPEDGSDDWGRFRTSPEARWLGVALPRFLLRLPYGEEGDPCDNLPFEEFPPDEAPPHGSYLWGNPGLLCALAVGLTFLEGGWERLPGAARQISGLPLDVRKVEGEARAKPCGEVLLTEPGVQYLMDVGVMPVASRKESDAVHLVRLGSAARPSAPLPGPWQGL
jgi:type VI secretion system protein ImpC